jgi:hypothetical protein
MITTAQPTAIIAYSIEVAAESSYPFAGGRLALILMLGIGV